MFWGFFEVAIAIGCDATDLNSQEIQLVTDTQVKAPMFTNYHS